MWSDSFSGLIYTFLLKMASPMYLAVGDGCHLGCVALVGQFGILHMAAVFQEGKPQCTSSFYLFMVIEYDEGR